MAAAHIGIVLHDFSTGGSERIAIRLSNAWAKAGRRVTIFCGTQEGALRVLVSPEVAVYACMPVTARSPVSRFVTLPLRMRRDIDRLQPDILFAPGNYHLVVFGVLGRLRMARRPLFVCKLSNPVRNGKTPRWLGAIGDWVTRVAAAPVDAFTAMSPSLRAQALTLFTRHIIHHIDEPVLEDEAVIADRSSPPCTQTPIIICVGRLVPQKDFALALAVFAQIDPGLGARLIFLGEGPEYEPLMAEALRLGIADRVDFKGYVADVRSLLSQASLFLMTSRYEGYPAVLIEAMAAGLPIVTTDCSPAIREIVTSPAHGQVVDGRDPVRIAHAVEVGLAAPLPPHSLLETATARNRMGVSSAAYLRCFDELVAAARRDENPGA